MFGRFTKAQMDQQYLLGIELGRKLQRIEDSRDSQLASEFDASQEQVLAEMEYGL